jgi:LysR family nitrogen assimilation transcriptional regulator
MGLTPGVCSKPRVYVLATSRRDDLEAPAHYVKPDVTPLADWPPGAILTDMEMRQMRYFVEIAEHRSFSRAARKLAVAQPALSRQIRLLEQALGSPLFYRNGRGVTLTAAGELLLGHARDILQRIAVAEQDVLGLSSTPKGEVVLGLPPSVSATLLRPVVVSLAERFPSVQLRAREGFSASVAEWLLAGTVDLAIVYDTHCTRSTLADELLVEQLYLVHSPAMRLPGTVSLSDLAHIPLVLPARPHGLRMLVEKAAHGLAGGLDIRFEIDSLNIMKELASDGIVATILPVGAVTREVEQKLLQATPLASPNITRRMMLATAANRPLESAHRTVLQIIREVAGSASG